MKHFKVKQSNFLDWYYNTGADQDQEQMRKDLGESIIAQLIENGAVKITAKDIWMECEKECMPIRICEGQDEDDDRELGELGEKYKITMIED